jgi:hypothetical protein
MGDWGLTKRELFAAMAMQGILGGCDHDGPWDPEIQPRAIADNAVLCADALLDALEESDGS